MLPICSAAPCGSLFRHITYEGSRMLYPVRKLNEGKFYIDEMQGFYTVNGDHVQNISFKTKAAKFIYTPIAEAPNLPAFQDPLTFVPYPDSFDDIVRGFSNDHIDEHDNWSCLANEMNRPCPLSDYLKYVKASDIPGSYALNHELEGESLYVINYGNTSMEALTSQHINLSTVTDTKVDEVAKIPEIFVSNLSGLSSLASSKTFAGSDATPGTSPGSPLMIPNVQEVASKEFSLLIKNTGNFFSGIEESVENLLIRANEFATTMLDPWKLALSDTLKGGAEIYESVNSTLFSSIDNSKEQASNQLARFSIKLEENISMAGAMFIDILRGIIIGVENGILNGLTLLVYKYTYAKTFLPPDITNSLNILEDDITRNLSSIGATLRQVYESIEEFERNLGLDPNDPLVPFLLLIGTTFTLGVSYWLVGYNGYSLSPERTLELLKNDGYALLVDVRPETIRERDGIPDLRREARFKYASLNPLEIDYSKIKMLKGGKEVDNALMAVVIRNLKKIKKGSKVIVMDSDAGRSNAIARSLKNLGMKEPYFVEGGFQAWARRGLRIKKPRSETALTLLNEEVEAILEDIKPSPIQVIGCGLGALVAIYSLFEWEKTLQIIGIVGLGQILYGRVASYKDSQDLKRDVRLLIAPVALGANAISWVTGKFEPKMTGLPTSPSSTAVQNRVIQAAAKHESQPSDADDIQEQASKSSDQSNKELDISEA